MRVGATISTQQMDYLRQNYIKIRAAPKYSLPIFDGGFRAPMLKQFETALAAYRNEPFDFDVDRCEGPNCYEAETELTNGEKFSKCGKCKEVFYCGKQCQTDH